MELTLDQALQKGVEAHKAGKVQEADRYYTAILKANPKHSDANHNMGVLAVGVGKVEEALPFFKAALESNPNIAQYWLSYTDALIKLDRIADAKAVLEQAKSSGVKGDSFDEMELRLTTSSVEIENQTRKDIPTQPNILDELKLDKALKLAKKKVKDGLSREAKKIYQDILKKFPKNKKALDGIKTLVSSALASTTDIQEPPSDQLQSIVNIYTQGQYQEVLTQASRLQQQFPNSVNLYNIVGAANRGLGKQEVAIEAYTKALSIKPDYAEAHNNIGVTLQQQGKLEEAVKAHSKALSIKPDYTEAYYNMGNALKEQGTLDEAILAYTKALAIKPDYAEAYYNMGIALKEQGKLGEAIEAYNKALSIKPDYASAYNNMGLALREVTFTKSNRNLQKTIYALLDKGKYSRPTEIANSAISLLKLEPNLKKQIQLANKELMQKPIDVIMQLNRFPLLLKLMSICPLPDLELEELFKNLRFAILSNISSIEEASSELMDFQSALALQCFTNEYIYQNTEEEKKKLRSLEKSVQKAFQNNEQPAPQMILALASYKSLIEYDWYDLVVVTDEIREVFSRQVEESNEEEKLKQNLQILEEITDGISSEVRVQYEENPYPRWVNTGLSLRPISISNMVDQFRLKLHENRINEVEKPEILIAGCGTGQHSIGAATKFKGSSVLAIDLSTSSLAYAQRKTKELGIGNIKYMQADILDLRQLGKEFDIIESVGVLHHMDNPIKGWKILTDCLKPGGLMRIGLYSQLARKHIIKIRNEIKQMGISSTHAGVKSFRDIILKSDKDHHKQVLTFPDFYNVSELRDLLFHVKEHRFTITQLEEYLDKLGLKFCGFETQQISHFQRTDKYKGNLYDLNEWQAYEEANPRAFSGMYQFWCQKAE